MRHFALRFGAEGMLICCRLRDEMMGLAM